MGEYVQICVNQNDLEVDCSKAPTLLSGPRRAYLSSIIGFTHDQSAPVYLWKSCPDVSTVLEKTVAFAKKNGLEVELNDAAESVLARVEEAADLYDLTVERGTSLKENPIHGLAIPDFVRTLKPYQVPAAAHLTQVPNAANFSVPGSGKTTVVLAAHSILRQEKEVEGLVVVCPRSAFMPWEEEYEACYGTAPKAVRIIGPPDNRPALWRDARDADLVLLSYQMASNDSESLAALLRRRRIFLVLDESHYIKRLEGGTWAETLRGLAPFASRRAILTGTPAPNSILDVWSQMAFLWPNEAVFGSRQRFRTQAEEDEETAVEEVRNSLYPLYWRTKKRDLGLPQPNFHTIPVPMSRFQRAIYDALEARVLSDVVSAPENRDQLRAWRRARLIRLLQAASNPSLLARSSVEFRVPPLDAVGLPVDQIIEDYQDYEMPNKIDAVQRLANDLVQSGRKVLIWTSFIHNIEMLEQLLEPVRPAKIFGGVPKDETENAEVNRESIIRDFKTSDRYQVLIANPAACAESISLHKACHDAIYLDRTFNAAHFMQSMDRIHRIGLPQDAEINYYIMTSADSVDEVIEERLAEKLERMHAILNDDFAVLDLESEAGELSEPSEAELDFQATLDAIQARIRGREA